MHDDKHLREPTGAKLNGTPVKALSQEQATLAYLEAISAIPALEDIADALSDIAADLSFLRKYLERKGMSEGILSPEDLEDEEDGEEKKPDESPA